MPIGAPPYKWTAEIEDERRASIYGLFDHAGNLRYIGKANDPVRRLASHMRDSRRRDTPVYRWIRKNGLPVMSVLSANCVDWGAEERRLIAEARARGDKLLNVAEGGDEPFCPVHVRAANGLKAVAARIATPERARLYELKRSLGQNLKHGYVSKKTRAKMRGLAKDYPEQFLMWANA